jgi:hypothetical protein
LQSCDECLSEQFYSEGCEGWNLDESVYSVRWTRTKCESRG